MEFTNIESQLRDTILKMIIVAWVGAVKALAEGESNSNYAESGTWNVLYM
jgi:hypothetical protein